MKWESGDRVSSGEIIGGIRTRSRGTVAGFSDPHRHDHVGVVVAIRADGFHDRLAHLVFELERDRVGLDDARKSSTYCALKQMVTGAAA